MNTPILSSSPGSTSPQTAPKPPEAAGDVVPAPLPASFAAVSANEAKAMPLSPAQRTAIEKMTSGHTLIESAIASGVSRSTMYRWLKNDVQFQAAYNAWQHDAMATARGRLLALTEKAVSVVAGAIQGGDRHLAMRLLERLGAADPARPGSADAQKLQRKEKLKREKEEVEFQKQEQDLAMDRAIFAPPPSSKR